MMKSNRTEANLLNVLAASNQTDRNFHLHKSIALQVLYNSSAESDEMQIYVKTEFGVEVNSIN